jgi:hypothetical protein
MFNPLNEFDVGGHTYRAGRLIARTQFHIVRRLGTIAPAFGLLLAHAKDFKSAPLSVAEPFLKALGDMPDETADYIIDACLAVVERRDGSGQRNWFRIQAPNGALAYDDIEMADMLTMVWHVLQANLKPFSFGALSAAETPEVAAATGSRSPTEKTSS